MMLYLLRTNNEMLFIPIADSSHYFNGRYQIVYNGPGPPYSYMDEAIDYAYDQ